jgi:hypothetical protein
MVEGMLAKESLKELNLTKVPTLPKKDEIIEDYYGFL